MYPGVTSVRPVENHRLIVGFDNGEIRVFDLRPLLSIGRFHELAVSQAFNKVRVAFDTVEWENGLDLDPEYIYAASEPMSYEHPAAAVVPPRVAER